jgi:uncharacterized membrane protein
MAPGIIPTPTPQNSKLLTWSSLVLTLLGAADAIYLLVLKITQAEVMCVGSHGCITVNNSSYAEVYGIPISVIGLFAYLAIAAILILEPRWKLASDNGPLAVFGISLVGVLYSVYLTYIELYVIFAVCPFCVASAILITLIFILAIIRLGRQNAL